MTVGHGIGLDVGDVDAIAILQSSGAPTADPPVLIAPATLRVSPTAAVLGAPPDEPGVLSRFVAAVGDPAGVTAEDGTVFLAEDLLATATASLLATAMHQFPSPPGEPTVITTHPAHWTDDQVGALRAALDRVGSWSVRLIPDAVAAVAWFEAVHGTQGESTVAVCDFGATGLTVSLVRTGDDPHLLPPSTFAPPFGGDSFDDTVAEHVLGAAAPALGVVDPRDPQIRADLDRLRAQCRAAKEQLTSVDEVTVPVAVGGAATTVTVTRSQFDEMLRGPLEGALSLVEGTLRAHELDAGALRAILLTGGGAAIPLLGELAGSLPAPAVLAPHPRRAAAHGAAIIAAAPAGPGAFGSAVAMPIAAASALDGNADGVDGDADTDRLPVVSAHQAPGAFTQASPGTPVEPAAAPAPRPARNRRVLVAAGTLAALILAAAVAFAATRDSDTGDTAVYVVPAPTTTTTTRATTTSPRPTTTDTSLRTTEPTLAPSTTPVLPPPVTTTAALPPAVTTAAPPPAVTTIQTTTTRPRRTTEEDETTTTTTTTDAVTTTTTTTTEEAPVAGPGDDAVTEPPDNP